MTWGAEAPEAIAVETAIAAIAGIPVGAREFQSTAEEAEDWLGQEVHRLIHEEVQAEEEAQEAPGCARAFSL